MRRSVLLILALAIVLAIRAESNSASEDEDDSNDESTGVEKRGMKIKGFGGKRGMKIKGFGGKRGSRMIGYDYKRQMKIKGFGGKRGINFGDLGFENKRRMRVQGFGGKRSGKRSADEDSASTDDSEVSENGSSDDEDESYDDDSDETEGPDKRDLRYVGNRLTSMHGMDDNPNDVASMLGRVKSNHYAYPVRKPGKRHFSRQGEKRDLQLVNNRLTSMHDLDGSEDSDDHKTGRAPSEHYGGGGKRNAWWKQNRVLKKRHMVHDRRVLGKRHDRREMGRRPAHPRRPATKRDAEIEKRPAHPRRPATKKDGESDHVIEKKDGQDV